MRRHSRAMPGGRGSTLVLCLLLASSRADAWSRETHRSIVEAALLISPAAAARVESLSRGAILEASEAPDPFDPDCRTHHGVVGGLDAPARAEKILHQILSAKGPMVTRYFRAQLIGQYAHFVADAAAPASAPAAIGTGARYFPSQNFIIFREQGSLGDSLAASLRARGSQSRWGLEDEESRAAAFRLAANLVADALVLLPREGRSKDVADMGPVIFVVDRMDTGLGSTKIYTQYLRSDAENDYYMEYRKADSPANRVAPLPDRPGLHVVEWLLRPQDRFTAVRALLLNNDKRCATRIILGQGAWHAPLSMTLAPYAIKVVDLVSPSDVRNEKVSGRWDSYECSGSSGAETGVSSVRRLIVASSPSGPVFDTSVQEMDMSRGGVTAGSPPPPSSAGGIAAVAGDAARRQGEALSPTVASPSAAPFFGKRSVAAFVRATEVNFDPGGCPRVPVKVFCLVQNISKVTLRGLKARLLIEDPVLRKTIAKIQPLSPPDLAPGQRAELAIQQSCDWGRGGGKYTFLVDDVSGTSEP